MTKIGLALGALAMTSLTAAAGSAQAFELRKCADAGVGLEQLDLPAAQNSRMFAQGAIALYNVGTEEPAAASAGVAVVLQTSLEEGGAICMAVTELASVDVMKAKASYDRDRGLLVEMPTKINDNGLAPIDGPALKIRINQKLNTIRLEK